MNIVRFLGFICVILFTYSTSSFGAVVLNIENGILMGATGVNVNGNIYDVTFQDGTCFDLFNGCNESSDFFFPVPDMSTPTIVSSEGYFANQALLDQVFLDSTLGEFDSDPTLTNGCTYWRSCHVYTPVFPTTIGGVDYFTSIFAGNAAGIDEKSIGTVFGTPVTADSYTPGVAGDFAFAIWSNNVSAVPVPAAVWLFGSGLIGLNGIDRRKKAYRLFSIPQRRLQTMLNEKTNAPTATIAGISEKR